MTRRSRLQLFSIDYLKSLKRRAGLPALLLRFCQFSPHCAGEAGTPRQAEDLIDSVGFAPTHQSVAGKVGTHYDPRVRPGRSDLPDDASDLLHRAAARTKPASRAGYPKLLCFAACDILLS